MYTSVPIHTHTHITYDVHVSMDTVAVGVWVCLKAAVKGEALLAIICFEVGKGRWSTWLCILFLEVPESFSVAI